ncbi:MAG: 3-keto-disaccharide hydrolase [Thermoguttaceae bacterium]
MRRLTAFFGIALLANAALLASAACAAEKPAKWKPLWDGKTLAGWHKIGVGQWTIEDGAIVGRKNKEDPNFGHLVTDAAFADFTVRLKFKALKGNSGFYFRIEEKGASGVSGFQAEIDPAGNTGGLYETNGRGFVVIPNPELVKKALKPGQWNQMVVSAHDGDITVTLNGVKTAELKNDPGKWRKGPLALQLHGGNDMLVMFKDIEILQQ